MSGSPSTGLPEIGPYLGRLPEVTRRFDDPTLGLDSVRLQLVSDLFELTDAARGFLSVDDFPGARSALDRPRWLEIWRAASNDAAVRTVAALKEQLVRAQANSGCPERILRRFQSGAEAQEILAAQLAAAGIPLERQIARGFPAGAGWWEAVRQAASALEDSWEQLEDIVRRELADGRRGAAVVEAWRPSPVPWVVAAASLTAVLGWVGLVLGGYLPRPSWLEWLARAFWSLPWP